MKKEPQIIEEIEKIIEVPYCMLGGPLKHGWAFYNLRKDAVIVFSFSYHTYNSPNSKLMYEILTEERELEEIVHDEHNPYHLLRIKWGICPNNSAGGQANFIRETLRNMGFKINQYLLRYWEINKIKNKFKDNPDKFERVWPFPLEYYDDAFHNDSFRPKWTNLRFLKEL